MGLKIIHAVRITSNQVFGCDSAGHHALAQGVYDGAVEPLGNGQIHEGLVEILAVRQAVGNF